MKEARKIVQTVLRSLLARGVAHGDIKPRNLLLLCDGSDVKLRYWDDCSEQGVIWIRLQDSACFSRTAWMPRRYDRTHGKSSVHGELRVCHSGNFSRGYC